VGLQCHAAMGLQCRTAAELGIGGAGARRGGIVELGSGGVGIARE
jgi:hypothetical protein